MTNTDVILIAIIATLCSGASVWILTRKINQCIPAPENVLTRSAGDIELGNIPALPYQEGVIEPTQPLPVHFPTIPPHSEGSGWYSEPINWIESNPLDSITVIEGLNSDPISTLSQVDSEVESLGYDSENLEPINYQVQDFFINSILENEYNLDYLLIIIIILIIIISIFIILKNITNKPAITYFLLTDKE